MGDLHQIPPLRVLWVKEAERVLEPTGMEDSKGTRQDRYTHEVTQTVAGCTGPVQV